MKKASTVERYGRWYVGRGQNKGASNIFSLFRQTEVGLSRPSEKCRITGKAPERQIGGFSRLPDSELWDVASPKEKAILPGNTCIRHVNDPDEAGLTAYQWFWIM